MKARNTFTWIGLAALVLLAMLAAAWGQERVLYPVKAQGGERASAGKPAQPGWRVLDPVTYENISVFPVVVRATPDTSAFLTLDEGLASGQVQVTESGGALIRRSRDGRPVPMTGGAQVNQLVLINRSSKPLVLLAGELVSGGKQDRIIAKDRIVPPGADPLPLDVFCVEHGRWSSGNAFAASKVIVHPSVRERAAVDQKQDQVWSAVNNGTNAQAEASGAGRPAAAPAIAASELAVVVSESGTQSYDKIYNRSRIGQSVEAFAEEVQRRFARATKGLKDERVVGVVIAYGGEVAWADAFASPQLFESYWPKLLRSYAVEALARPRTQERAPLDDAREFLEPLAGRETIESEPGVYRWRQIAQGRYAEIALDAFTPKMMMLHWVKIHRTS